LATFSSFDEYERHLREGTGLLLFVLTERCGRAGRDLGRRVEVLVGPGVTVHLLCAEVEVDPSLVLYEGGDPRALVAREGAEAIETVGGMVVEARRLAATRLPVVEEAARQEAETLRAERMLETERLDAFPTYFQMARNLARDAWHAARATAEGAPLLLDGESSAARLAVCVACPSYTGDRCEECGCYMNIKAHFAAMRCPLGKWPESDAHAAGIRGTDR
jgi:hypothetical protein